MTLPTLLSSGNFENTEVLASISFIGYQMTTAVEFSAAKRMVQDLLGTGYKTIKLYKSLNFECLFSKLVVHPECFPIAIPDNDPFYSKHGQKCMNFVRSMPAPQLSCNFGFGEQMNQITGFLDGKKYLKKMSIMSKL